MITDANGFVVKDFYYDPWGASRTPTNDITQWMSAQPFQKVASTISSRGFTDHEHLDEVGLIHMNGRIYDPKLARFVQADPIIQDPLRVQSLNRYSYVWNNPLNATDPSGFTRQQHWNGGDEPELDEEEIEETFTYGYVRDIDFSDFDDSISDRSYSVDWGDDGYSYEPSSSDSSNRGLYGDGNAQKAHEAALLFWPGYDFGTCISQGDCSTTDWLVASLGIIPGGKAASLGVKSLFKWGTKGGAESARQAAHLKEHLLQAEKYGKGGFKDLQNGRVRYYGEIVPANKSGEMAGRRTVREWDPATGNKRTWHETLDHNGNVRQVRPEFNNGTKIHYTFDKNGNYTGSW